MTVLACALFTSCSDDLDFSFDNEGKCYTTDVQKLSAADFQRIVEGYGWRETETHEIEPNGKVKGEDYWDDMIGGGPSRFEFLEGGQIKRYLFLDAYPVSGYRICDYSFEPGMNYLTYGSSRMQVLKASETRLTVIYGGAWRDNDEGRLVEIFFYAVFERVDEETVEGWRNGYKTNLDEWTPAYGW